MAQTSASEPLESERGQRETEQLGILLVGAAAAQRRIGELLASDGVQIAHFADTHELGALAALGEPSLVVLSLAETPASPAKQVAPVRESFPLAPILLVCAELQPWKVRAALGSGVAGIVFEHQLTAVFEACLRAVLAGQICVPQRLRGQIEPPILSAREKQVLGLVVLGYMNSQIAQQLFLAESTVKSHLSSAFSKLGVRSRNEAVELIVDPDGGLGTGILALGGEPLTSPIAPAEAEQGADRASRVAPLSST